MPKQTSTDCGSENTIIHGLATALRWVFTNQQHLILTSSYREAFQAAQDNANGIEKPAHIFLRSMHHIPIERGWLDFRKDFGHNFPHFWGAGSLIYEEHNENHRYVFTPTFVLSYFLYEIETLLCGSGHHLYKKSLTDLPSLPTIAGCGGNLTKYFRLVFRPSMRTCSQTALEPTIVFKLSIYHWWRKS